MNLATAAFTVLLGVLMLALPRRLAAVPLLLGACYSGPMAVVEIGPAHFSVLRILVLLGFMRIMVRSEHIEGGRNGIDNLVLTWAVVLVLTGLFHTQGALTYRAGLIWGEIGSYFLLRVFIRDSEDIQSVFKSLCIIMLPIAAAMLLEKATGRNLFAALGGFGVPNIRNGHIRAVGPFSHPILAGTAGASCLLMATYLWREHRKHSIVGIVACLGIVFASTSSGPLMMVIFAILGLAFWRFREHMRLIRWSALVGVIALNFAMKDPVYFLMARVDLTGSSQGYFRAQLIRSSIQHLNEWWLFGTDYTRHWMASGNHANTIHTDITNHLLGNGVMGGLPLVIVMVCVLTAGFRTVGKALREGADASMRQQWLAWTLGAILFAHVANFFSVSLFDQSIVLFYLTLVCIGGLRSSQPALSPSSVPVSRPRRVTVFPAAHRPRMIRR